MEYAFFNGQITPIEEAKVSIRVQALHYGTAIYEGIRAYWNEEHRELYAIKMAEHYERMKRNCRLLELRIPYTVEGLCNMTLELLRKNRLQQDTYIRPLAYISSEAMKIGQATDTGFAVITVPLGEHMPQAGVKVICSSWRRVEDDAIPPRGKIAGVYVNTYLARREALARGCDEAIFLTRDGHISEGGGSNFFLVRNGGLITPPPYENILEGITRESLIRLAEEEMKIATEVRRIDKSELYIADEAFLCGTGAQVTPILEADGHPVGDGQMGLVTAKLRDLYFDIVRGNNPKYRGWCTPVYGR